MSFTRLSFVTTMEGKKSSIKRKFEEISELVEWEDWKYSVWRAKVFISETRRKYDGKIFYIHFKDKGAFSKLANDLLYAGFYEVPNEIQEKFHQLEKLSQSLVIDDQLETNFFESLEDNFFKTEGEPMSKEEIKDLSKALKKVDLTTIPSTNNLDSCILHDGLFHGILSFLKNYHEKSDDQSSDSQSDESSSSQSDGHVSTDDSSGSECDQSNKGGSTDGSTNGSADDHSDDHSDNDGSTDEQSEDDQ